MLSVVASFALRSSMACVGWLLFAVCLLCAVRSVRCAVCRVLCVACFVSVGGSLSSVGRCLCVC